MADFNRQNLHVDLIRKRKIRLQKSASVDNHTKDVIDETLGPEDQLIRSQNLDQTSSADSLTKAYL